jgi:hydroxyacylglutathione hydrolase
MLYLKSFTFNPFQENTYVLYNEAKEAFIIDPGNSNTEEHLKLQNFISENELQPLRLLLTHGHLDHVLGNKFIYDTYGLLPEVHKDDLFFVESMVQTANMYGIPCEASPMPEKFLSAGDTILLGTDSFACIHAPGHSPGSLCFYNKENKLLIGGDVLFQQSIGRSDLPKGDHNTLINSIQEKLMVLDDDVKVFSGHGPATTIGQEKLYNPFLT